ncbi:type I polyketide synthase [Streptomyces zagrosensis]|uniref:Acyl transferase domain-containing protein/NADPH:quinone reductase-like Zn-dependent oxidoreductase/acyl carrier protein n=1 Tax=Streptomyces zagrosensis TaxID=1042984 RepID=A0A7W9QBT9_9ACTN|nr:type I polyketide synthase [Streptomyces zagrosensis]MBB5937029.1 acyl transferase domain-containing protein/NADPH:quinone reductase-like Zn-dependent oxidoreductase/acyl carrier protein [Streptomyces zagrosensis]
MSHNATEQQGHAGHPETPSPNTAPTPIAIVGIGLRIPGGSNAPDEFAEFLRTGQSGVRELPTDRWDPEGLTSDDPEAKGVIRCERGGFVDRIDHFDAKFYNVSPKEADYIDPQQRLTLETAWEALEDAGIDPGPLRHGRGGVYVAVSNTDYAGEMGAYSHEELNSYMPTGAALSAVSGRLSYFLGWRGPCMTIDTACSASLVAVHLAAQGLRENESDIALCVGVNAIINPRPYILASQSNMLAPDGRCKTFDETANGYCRSEGGGALVLKRLSDAQRDGDQVYAVVRGSAVGSDGESSSLMVPNGTAQEGLMRQALHVAGLRPHDISYIEAHGTGTPLGDPIEISAITSVFSESHSPQAPVTIGSLKTNVGHMESAAGIGGLVKTALQMRESTIFPHLNFTTPSSRIPWETAPVAVATEARPWKAETKRALVNSFGLTGTIASVVLEQAPERTQPATPADDGGGHLLTLSAKSAPALTGQIQRYQRMLRDKPETDVGDLCYTSNVARAHFPLRLAGVVRDHDDVARLLDRGLAKAGQAASAGGGTQVAFLFSGGGTQYVGMGRPLYERFEVFREHLDDCDRLFTPHLGRSIRDMILGEADDADLIHQISYMQPALYALEYAVAKLWLSWGVRPSVLAGHSIGEIVAATVAGLFTLEDAVTLMAARARLMAASPPGAMAAVEASVAEVAGLLEDHDDLSIAAVNGTRQLVLSGGKESLSEVERQLTERGIKNRRLAVSCASHSPLMAEAAQSLREVVAGLTFHEPEFTLISNLTGTVADPAEISRPDYWARHLREGVKFADGMRAIAERGRHVFLECGPSTELIGMGKQCLDDAAGHTWLNSLHTEDTDATITRQALTQLYAAGAAIDWVEHHRGRERHRITLPTYAFDRRRHWLPAPAALPQPGGAPGGHPLLGKEVSTDDQRAAGVREFGSRISAERPAYLTDHKVMGKIVFPGAGYVEMLIALQDAVYGESALPITDVSIHEALFIAEEGSVELRTRLVPRPDGPADVEIVSLLPGDEPGTKAIERRHITATVATGPAPALAETEQQLRELAEQAGEPSSRFTADDIYADFTELGVGYGPLFQGLTQAEAHGTDLAIGELRGQDGASAEHLPPAILDCAFQTITALSGDSDVVAMPVGIGSCRLLKKPRGAKLRSVLRLAAPEHSTAHDTDAPDAAQPPGPVLDLLVLEGDRTVFVMERLTLRQVANAAPDRDRMYSELRWVKRSLRAADPEPRHALLIGPGEQGLAELAEPAKDHNVTLTVVASAAETTAALRDRPADVCWFWQPRRDAQESLRSECERNYRDLLILRDALEEVGFGRDQRLWLITEGGQWVPGDRPEGGDEEATWAAATLWGFGHVMWTEYPAQRVTLIDLPVRGSTGAYPALLDEWAAKDSTEYQVAYRSGLRHVRRVYAGTGGPSTADVELVIKEYGQFTGVVAAPLQEEPEPQGSEVRVRVRAAGLSLKDVFNVLGLHRVFAEEAGTGPLELPLGQECAGEVIAAGPEASFTIGDEVMVAHLGSLRRQVTVESAQAVRKPEQLTFAQAAALPTAFLVAHHALHRLAGIKKGDRVLIHAAAGGVGQAAVRLAQRAGAEVYATASPHKWPLLRSQGVQHLMNSRSHNFADEVLKATEGKGVHIVLNSLDKDFAQVSLRAVAPGGHFVELGKVGLLSAQEVAQTRPDITYIDDSDVSAERTRQRAGDALATLAELVSTGEFTPLPTTTYTLDEIDEAFGAVSRGALTGKAVIAFHDENLPAAPPAEIGPDRTYLVTGGLGSLGQLAAEKLVGLGARHIALMGRRTPSETELAALQTRLGPDTEVITYAADVSEADDVRRVSADLRSRPQPLGGIIHAAGVLADAPVTAQTWESLDTVFGAKVYGTHLLHQEAASHPELTFFIGYSSLTSVLGSRGQANYAAGNAFLDTLMWRRRAAGQPGMSVNWGAWGEIGLAATMDEQHIANVEHQGFGFFKPTTGMRSLIRLLERPPAQVTIAEVDWDQCVATRPLPNALYHQVGRAKQNTAVNVDLDALLQLSKSERRQGVSLVVRGVIADLLHFDGADDVPPDARFFEVGLDSLAAVELKNALELCFRLPLSASSVFDHPSVSLLGEFIDGQLTTAGQGGRS